MIKEIFIGICSGLIVGAIIYFAGVSRTKKRQNSEEKQQRIYRVFDSYMQRTSTGGFDGLLKAGVTTLKNDSEIREVVKLIISHDKQSPIGARGELDGKDLKIFFDYAAKNKINFLTVPHEEVIRDSGV